MAELSRLPEPLIETWSWQAHGACRGKDPEMFFHPEGERGRSRRLRVEIAKAVCATCPVIAACREHALSVREPYGVWGGMSEEERRAAYAASTPKAS
ncbi:Sporulation regulatory protein WhiD [Actinomycetales bacterium JB111]|nr:Sporulation regulatory protein WhiD [Actinomycetales bacterium JB111]